MSYADQVTIHEHQYAMWLARNIWNPKTNQITWRVKLLTTLVFAVIIYHGAFTGRLNFLETTLLIGITTLALALCMLILYQYLMFQLVRYYCLGDSAGRYQYNELRIALGLHPDDSVHELLGHKEHQPKEDST